MVESSSSTVAGTFTFSAFDVLPGVLSRFPGMAFAERPPSNLYMPPKLRLSGSKPVTPYKRTVLPLCDTFTQFAVHISLLDRFAFIVKLFTFCYGKFNLGYAVLKI